jgi:N-acetylglucosaminyl-diphospho-decaprenol L-rhamnosyltransferase
MDLSIIIVNWNTCDLLVDCLNSIQENLGTETLLQAETFVVDNASSDGSAEAVRSGFLWVHLIENQTNVGFARANNQAVALAQGKYVLLLNPDTVLHPSAIKTMLAYLDSYSDVGAVGPRVVNPDDSVQITIYPQPTLMRETWRLFHLDRIFAYGSYSTSILDSESPRVVDILMGVCIMLRREIVENLGLFDEQFFVFSEDFDLCVRIRNAGWQIHWLPKAVITHHESQSTKQIPDEMFLELYRNKVKFFRKHYGSGVAASYKVLLFIVSLTRYIPGWVGGKIPAFQNQNLSSKSNHYRKLITALPDF